MIFARDGAHVGRCAHQSEQRGADFVGGRLRDTVTFLQEIDDDNEQTTDRPRPLSLGRVCDLGRLAVGWTERNYYHGCYL